MNALAKTRLVWPFLSRVNAITSWSGTALVIDRLRHEYNRLAAPRPRR